MKKVLIASVIIISSLTFSACTKENVAPRKNSTLLVEDGNKDQLGQGDGNKDQLGQGDGGTTTP